MHCRFTGGGSQQKMRRRSMDRVSRDLRLKETQWPANTYLRASEEASAHLPTHHTVPQRGGTLSPLTVLHWTVSRSVNFGRPVLGTLWQETSGLSSVTLRFLQATFFVVACPGRK